MKHSSQIYLWTTLIAAACTDGPVERGDPQPTPELSASEFVSADGIAGQESVDGGLEAASADGDENGFGDAGSRESTRTVEEGDIYRLGPDGRVYNLNSYRGLQIIDVSDPSDPKVEGRARLNGAPVEMYHVGNVLYALMNGAHSYYGNRDDVRAERYQGGLVVAFDVRDPKRPLRLGQARVPGYISTSRLTRGDGEALYVAASNNGKTYVVSFTLRNGSMSKKSELDLGGYVQDIQATTSHLLVASHDWQSNSGRSQVAIVDISDPSGTMVQGATVLAEGRIQTKFNMDVHGSMLRLVSGNSWGNSRNTNHVETFDISDITRPRRLDHETFGDNEDLYATLFMGEKAFFVTYRRVDPFHAFSIASDGKLTERSEFIVSGWNDFFFPVAGGRRLIGIGTDDQNGQTKAVSLYDITHLDNPSPLLVRKDVQMQYSWSEANWEDKAVSVLEDAVSVTTDDGTVETGLVLLPYQGWNRDGRRYETAVQIFTFSETTLTRRGIMKHGSPVRRSFLVEPDTAGNLSEMSLSIYDTAQPDVPRKLGEVELAPYIRTFKPLDNGFGLRVENDQGWYGWNYERPQDDRIEIVRLAGDVENQEPVATLNVPNGSFLFVEGPKLRVLSQTWDDDYGNATVHVRIYDLSDPRNPKLTGELSSRDLSLRPVYAYGYGYGGPEPFMVADCASPYCWGYYGGEAKPNVLSLDDSLVFVEPIHESEKVGEYHVEYRYPVDRYGEDCWDENGPKACSYLVGGISCTTLTANDGTRSPAMCTGSFGRCTQNVDGQTECVEIDPDSVRSEKHEYEHDAIRHWVHYDLKVVDLTSATPQIGPTVSMARADEAVTVLGDGDKVFLNSRRPFRLDSDPRPYVRYYFQEVDLSRPDRPRLGSRINIPGQLLAVDGNRLITRDFLWGRNILESSVNQLELDGGRAYLRGIRRFEDELVQRVVLDGAGLALVSHTSWEAHSGYGFGYGYGRVAVDDVAYYGGGYPDGTTTLTLLDVDRPRLAKLSDVEVDAWAELKEAFPGRALFQVPGGMMVINTSLPTAPYAQAFFPIYGWASSLAVQGDDIYVGAGPYGLYRFDSDTFNLWPR